MEIADDWHTEERSEVSEIASVSSWTRDPADAHDEAAEPEEHKAAREQCDDANDLQRRGKYKEAENKYLKVLAICGNDRDYRILKALTHFNYASCLYKLKRYGKAEEHYRQALVLKPLKAKAHNNLALCHTKRRNSPVWNYQGRYREPEIHYREALKIDPDYAAAHYNYAFLLDKTGRQGKALKHMRKAAELNHEGAAELVPKLEAMLEQAD